uniref:NAD(P)-binding domain-containing protein n=1 Tax=Tetraselmis chuii TaxID=63592 RepID=A0A7S1TBA0_9CHLO|mmetsp:Transcript_8975/g.16158  ORF Transcript_8975/g.16158 Transcript_8975/m.16158 type:complete len:281 (+) Transcript_8975:62-904(+)|eukprot:CAMPEP_0177758304 /NCGR_PEP_ID=MMETSP0491_2-20121128/4113_1 /TAXON_ID=63592 /ORGANISM="Tetraselmis chuii, Strain PLY429" /LENGTH=280 /DNA_ID=CAMNT_0019274029 /DNA_START=60 /DNA_END=902 /DNA_ORIENTATION=-
MTVTASLAFSGRAAPRFGRVSAGARRQRQPRAHRLQVCAAKIAVIGGTGGTGSECVYQALEAGDEVVTLVRTPANLVVPPGSGGAKAGSKLESERLTVVQGNVTVQSDVDKVISDDVDGVVIALGGKTKDVGPTMLTDGTRCVINAMQAKGVKRVSVVTSIGAGDSEKQAPFFFKVLMFTVMKSIFNDKNNQEDLFISGPGKDLEYCIVRPGGLLTDPPTGVINVIDGEAGSIPRADVAAFCLGALTQKDFPYLGQAPCISSVGGTSWVKDRGDKSMFEA